MKNSKSIILLLIFFQILGSNAYSQKENILPVYFADSVMSHITHLVKLSPRLAGTVNERKASYYVRNRFRDIGLTTQVEKFKYSNFEFNNLWLCVNNDTITPTGLGYIPYNNITYFSDTATVVDSRAPFDNLNKQELIGKPIISDEFANHFKLLQLQPSLIIYLDSINFRKLKTTSKIYFELHIDGCFVEMESQNIIAQLGNTNPYKKEIIIGAHVDSKINTPGASDNASGVGVMIELARYLKSIESNLDYTIKFIAFGAEEIGILGSRKYILTNKHLNQKCLLYYNIDDVGGNGLGAIETLGGIYNPPSELSDSLFLSLAENPWEGSPDNWRILPTPYLMEFITTVNHPDWLVSAIENAVGKSNYKINFVKSLGADEMSFSHAGIPSTGIGITCDYPHTPFDKTDAINERSLTKAGEISIRVILNANNIK